MADAVQQQRVTYSQRWEQLDQMGFTHVRRLAYKGDPGYTKQDGTPLCTWEQTLRMEKDETKKCIADWELQCGMIDPDPPGTTPPYTITQSNPPAAPAQTEVPHTMAMPPPFQPAAPQQFAPPQQQFAPPVQQMPPPQQAPQQMPPPPQFAGAPPMMQQPADQPPPADLPPKKGRAKAAPTAAPPPVGQNPAAPPPQFAPPPTGIPAFGGTPPFQGGPSQVPAFTPQQFAPPPQQQMQQAPPAQQAQPQLGDLTGRIDRLGKGLEEISKENEELKKILLASRAENALILQALNHLYLTDTGTGPGAAGKANDLNAFKALLASYAGIPVPQ